GVAHVSNRRPCTEVNARSLPERRTGPLDVREDVLSGSALEIGARHNPPTHEHAGVHTGALASVRGGKAMVSRSRKKSLHDVVVGEAISGSEQIQLGDHLADGGRGEEGTRRTPVSRVSGTMVVDSNPPLRQLSDALDGVNRRALGDLGDRATVCVARMDTQTRFVCRVNDLLPALAEDELDELHLGVRRPEHPDPVSTHYYLHLVFAGAQPRVRAWGPA